MLLADLIREMPEARLIGDPQSTFTGVAYDSRAVASGAIFVAVQGMKADGHKYLAEAAAGGASSLVVQRDHESSLKAVLADLRLPALVVPDTRAALALIAAAVYDHPARRLGMIGVTGTDGKTSVSHPPLPRWGGRSELRRAARWVTPRRGNPTESGTETYRPEILG